MFFFRELFCEINNFCLKPVFQFKKSFYLFIFFSTTTFNILFIMVFVVVVVVGFSNIKFESTKYIVFLSFAFFVNRFVSFLKVFYLFKCFQFQYFCTGTFFKTVFFCLFSYLFKLWSKTWFGFFYYFQYT